MADKKKPKVLIVDDEPALLKVMAEYFLNDGFTVLKAKDGEEGLRVALSKHPDIILLDLLMPKMDGATMFDKLCEDKWGMTVPVIALTNVADPKTIVSNVRRGISDYLVKSEYKTEDVVKKVKERLGI